MVQVAGGGGLGNLLDHAEPQLDVLGARVHHLGVQPH